MARIIGLTGGIGTGKSTVAEMFRELGAEIVDADRLAREVVAPGMPAVARIAARFGAEVLTPEGELDRRKLGQRVFQDPAELAALNALLHPEIAALSRERIAGLLEAGARCVIYDVPLLFENGLQDGFDRVVVVSADPATQRARIRARDGLSESEIDQRLSRQAPLTDKVSRADFVIDNSGSLEATRARVREVAGAIGLISEGSRT